MTLKELSVLHNLNNEIKNDEKRLAELAQKRLSIKAQNMDGMPHSYTDGVSHEMDLSDAYLDLEKLIYRKKLHCAREQLRLENYITTIDDSLTRQIFEARFMDGLTWQGVAHRIGDVDNGDRAKKICYRYLDRIV